MDNNHRIERCEMVQDPVFPDVDVMIVLDSSVQELRGLADTLEDCHIISESIEEVVKASKIRGERII